LHSIFKAQYKCQGIIIIIKDKKRNECEKRKEELFTSTRAWLYALHADRDEKEAAEEEEGELGVQSRHDSFHSIHRLLLVFL